MNVETLTIPTRLKSNISASLFPVERYGMLATISGSSMSTDNTIGLEEYRSLEAMAGVNTLQHGSQQGLR